MKDGEGAVIVSNLSCSPCEYVRVSLSFFSQHLKEKKPTKTHFSWNPAQSVSSAPFSAEVSLRLVLIRGSFGMRSIPCQGGDEPLEMSVGVSKPPPKPRAAHQPPIAAPDAFRGDTKWLSSSLCWDGATMTRNWFFLRENGAVFGGIWLTLFSLDTPMMLLLLGRIITHAHPLVTHLCGGSSNLSPLATK